MGWGGPHRAAAPARSAHHSAPSIALLLHRSAARAAHPPPFCTAPHTAQVLPTVGLNLAHFEALGSPLLCWDVGGAAGLRGIWSK